ncbi:MAG: cytochrome c oxidase subunit II [Proteobacteria bacterium]|nr:cytochrome c oxidase subunit II [Pseudomonadota bacterium]
MIPQVFDAARQVDQAFLIILGISVGLLILVTALMAVFVVRYHHTRHPVAVEIPGNVWLELIWTIIPAILVTGMFWFGWSSYKAMRAAPENALAIGVESRMWSWSFIYPDGKRSTRLVVPVDTPVKLNMTSLDVIHSFYVPAMRIKMDTIPGMKTYVWFKSDTQADFDILCAEYCGLKHANMLATLSVVGADEYQAWLAGDAGQGAAKGVALLESYGCTGCHSLDGADGVGPSFKGLSGRRFTAELPDGSETQMVADEQYLKRAILNPDAEYVKGYSPAMPAYEGAIPEEDLTAMINFLLAGDATPKPAGRELAENEGCLSCHSTDGSVIAGPSFKGLAGSLRRVSEGDAVRSLKADREYLQESIVAPEKMISEGFEPMMPAYDSLEPAQLDALIDFIEDLGQGDQ